MASASADRPQNDSGGGGKEPARAQRGRNPLDSGLPHTSLSHLPRVTRPSAPSHPDDKGSAHPAEARSVAAAAHGAFADALGMLHEFTGGASLLLVEWELVQQLACQAAQLFDDLDAWHAANLLIALPRRWWEPPWTARDFDPPLKQWEWQQNVRTRTVEQIIVGGEVEANDATDDSWSFWVRAYLLGNDGVLRSESGDLSFSRAEFRKPPLKAGEMGPNDVRWGDLTIGAEATELKLEDIGFYNTEQLLRHFAELAATTRTSLQERIGRLREAGRQSAADHGETNPPLPS
jgi:hypothetical protein